MKRFIPLLLATSYLFCGCGSSEETTTTTEVTTVAKVTTEATTEKVTEQANQVTTNATTSTPTITEDISSYKKDSAKEKDSELWSTVISADNDIAAIQSCCSGITSGSNTFPELKALAQQIKNRQYTARTELINFNIDSNGADYLAYVKNYVAASIDICDNVIKAVDKVDESYLKDAITNIDEASNIALKIATSRMSYLEKAGFSSSEIGNIMAQ